ncbi:MAG TPA: hypothetical protein VGT61_02600 [Thermomicrobiales bacterium]|nr:hypothetical protein [Thermomicrobiales bacterium]
MEDVIGGPTDAAAFDRYLADWRGHLDRRVTAYRDALLAIPGIACCVLAGSVGRRDPWPLSDIDVIPVLEPGAATDLDHRVEAIRTASLPGGLAEGWWTGLDLGWLRFTMEEVDAALAADDPGSLIQSDRRWFHAIDKGYGGRALFDDDSGRAERLAVWWTANRFDPSILAVRRAVNFTEARDVLNQGRVAVADGNLIAATRTVRRAAHLVMIASLEGWGMRDNSLGRVGTRFAREAVLRGESQLMGRLHEVTDLADSDVAERMASAPWWVWQRHHRSIMARRLIGEDTTTIEDQRDTLRVAADYGSRELPPGEPPGWLRIPTEPTALISRIQDLERILDGIAGPP